MICCYFIFGYFDSVRGATLSEVMASNHLDYIMGGTLGLLYYFGYFISTLFGGILCDKISRKTFLAIGGGILIVAILGHMGTATILFVAVFLVGITLGIYEVAGNSAVVEVYPPEQRGKFLSIVAGAHSVGAVTAPFIYSAAIKAGATWHAAFYLVIPIIVISMAMMMFSKYLQQTYSVPSSFSITALKDALLAKNMRCYYAMIFLYIASEATMISWMVTFLTEERNIPLSTAPIAISIFFLLFGVGRFFGGAVLGKTPIHKIVVFCASFAALCIAVGIFVPSLPWALPVAGLFMSVICPMLVAATSNVCQKNAGASIGVFFSFAAVGGMTGAWITGQINQLFTIRWGLFAAVVFLLATACTALVEGWKAAEKQEACAGQ